MVSFPRTALRASIRKWGYRIVLSGKRLLLATAFAALLSVEAFAETAAQGTVEELKGCARMADQASRLACYEELGKRVLAAESVVEAPSVEAGPVEATPVEPVPVEAVAAAPAVEAVQQAPAELPAAPVPAEAIPSDLGQAKKEEKKKNEKPPVYRGRMASCRENADGIWYFTLENGQVWEQSSRGYHRFEQCTVDVSITKDFFGYKMTIEGGKTLRVRRYR